MASKQPSIPSQTLDTTTQSSTPETSSSRIRDIAAGTALSVALITNPAMAQVKDYYQAYMEQCTAQASLAQASFREKLNATITAEGAESPKVIKMQNALATSIDRTAKKCEEGAQLEAKGAQLEAKGAQIRQETAQITSIKNRFDKMGTELPQVDELLKELISQKGSASRKREIIHQLDTFVLNTKETLNVSRNISTFQTPEYRRLFASIEEQIEKIQQTLHGSKVAGI